MIFAKKFENCYILQQNSPDDLCYGDYICNINLVSKKPKNFMIGPFDVSENGSISNN